MRGSKRRYTRADGVAHIWLHGACAACGMRKHWPGATMPCMAPHDVRTSARKRVAVRK